MPSYFAAPARGGSTSGFGGGTFGLLGSVGPAWNDSFNTSMRTADNWYNLQNRVMLDQYGIPAQAAAYDNTLQDQARQATLNDAKKDITQWLAQTEQQALTDQVMQALGIQGNSVYPQNQSVMPPQQQQLQYLQTQPVTPAAMGPLTTQQNINNRLGLYNPAYQALGTGGY